MTSLQSDKLLILRPTTRTIKNMYYLFIFLQHIQRVLALMKHTEHLDNN